MDTCRQVNKNQPLSPKNKAEYWPIWHPLQAKCTAYRAYTCKAPNRGSGRPSATPGDQVGLSAFKHYAQGRVDVWRMQCRRRRPPPTFLVLVPAHRSIRFQGWHRRRIILPAMKGSKQFSVLFCSQLGRVLRTALPAIVLVLSALPLPRG